LKRGGWHRTHYGAAVTARKAPRIISEWPVRFTSSCGRFRTPWGKHGSHR
jgi:hypothetical protein